MNMAALWQLPVLFCCENNLYAMGTALERAQSQTDLTVKAAALRVPALAVDGMDVVAVPRGCAAGRRRTSAAAAARSSSNSAPIGSGRIRCSTRSSIATRPRSSGGASATRSARSPSRARGDGCARPRPTSRQIEDAAAAEIEDAVAFAEAGTWEPVEDLERDVLDDRRRRCPHEDHATGPPCTMPCATPCATTRASFLMGEDVGRYGGYLRGQPRDCWRSSAPSACATRRCRSLGFVGVGIGAALGGMRPIVEVMTVNFSLLALDQIVNTAAALRHMSGGQFSVPLVGPDGDGGRPPARPPSTRTASKAGTPTSRASRCWPRPPSRTRTACSARRWPTPTRW